MRIDRPERGGWFRGIVTRTVGDWALVAALVLGLSGCAGFQTERHLAPIWSKYSPAGGGVETESLGGAVVTHSPRPGERLDYWAVRPLVSRRESEDGEVSGWFLPPFGTYRVKERERVWQFLGVVRYAWTLTPTGEEQWSFLMFPGIYWAKKRDGRTVRAWFPFGGVASQFFSFDRLSFFLFPLYMRTERQGRVTYHYLFPFFSVTKGTGGPSWKVWPIASHKKWEGRYDRWSFLWPIVNFGKEDLDEPPERQRSSWTVMPLFGKSRRGDTRSYTALWPFFSYANNDESGFWALDGPWPIVRVLEPGPDAAEEAPRRRRFWPFYSYYKGDGLTSRWYLWPIVNIRKAVYPDSEKRTTNVFPFWHSWTREHEEEGRSTFRRLWPLVRRETTEDGAFFAVLALNPFWRLDFVDEHFAWLYQLYTRRTDRDRLRERTILGLYRRESDKDEDRRSLTFLWARRDYTERGRQVRDSSFLFGLLRFRSREGEGLEWLKPAVPGPGWPLERVPNSITSASDP